MRGGGAQHAQAGACRRSARWCRAGAHLLRAAVAAAVLARPCTPFITSSPAGGDASLSIARSRLRQAAGAGCARSVLLRPRGLDSGAAETGSGLGQRAPSRGNGRSTVAGQMAGGAHAHAGIERNETVREGERKGHADREAARQRQRHRQSQRHRQKENERAGARGGEGERKLVSVRVLDVKRRTHTHAHGCMQS